MSIKDTAGISLTSGFKLLAEDLIDKRCSLPTEADRDELVSLHAAPVGLIVYVKSTKRTYQYNGNGEWEYFSKGAEYTHPTGDGNLHVPATGTNHNGQFLSAGNTAGSIAWKTITPALIGAAPSVHHHSNDTIDSLDASKLTGVIDAERLPKVALERYTKVANDTARFALTKNDVQNGDTVKVESTEIMYYVIDDTKLDQDAGYEPYVAEKAKEVSWSGVINKPNTMSNEYPLEVKFNGGTANGKDSFTYYGSNKVSINITPEAIDAARKSHTHTKSEITDFPDSLKNPNSLSIIFNDGISYTYDGSESESILINPSTVGAAPAVHTHSYLPLSGGTMTGTINQKNLTLNDGFHNRLIIAAYCESDTGASDNGSEVTFGGGGNIFVGSGESHTALKTALSSGVESGELYDKTSEQMYLSSDNNIYFYTNIQTIANRVGIVFDSTGALRPLVNDTRTLGSSSIKWNNIYATTFTGNLSGNATSSTYARLTTLNPTSSTTYFLPFTTGTASNTNYSLNGNDGIRYNTLEGTANADGYSFLVLGNNVSSGTAGNKYGAIRAFGNGSYYTNLVFGAQTANRTITFPDATGTILNTGTTSFTQSLTSGTVVGTIKINGTSTTLYAPTNTDTHYASGTIVNNSTTATTNTTTALSNGNVYLNHIENGSVKNSHKISGSGATTVTTDASGNIIISSTDTNTNTDTKVTSATTNPTSSTTYYPTWVTGATTGSVLINNGMRYATIEGTASATGYGMLILGNSTASGKAGNKYGVIRAYGTGAYYTQLSFTSTATRTITFPDATGTVALTGHTHSYLPLSGGTLTGTLIQSKGSYVHSSDAGSGSTGYINIATLTVTASYANAPITIELSKRGAAMTCTLYISFANASSTDPGLGYFKYTGADYGCYISRVATSTWKLYVTKSEAYDNIGVVRYHKPAYMTGVTLTWWSDTYVSALPDSYVKAVVGGNIYHADAVDGFHASQSAGSKSTCVVTDSNGYTHLNYINSNTSNNENPSISQVIVTNGSDNYYRKASLSHLKSSLGEMTPASNSNYYVKVWNSGTNGGVDNLSVTELAKKHFAMAMVNNATDNPLGSKSWIHAISMAWKNDVNTSWVSQIALGAQASDGMWYRTTQGSIVGASWKRVLDSSNYKSYCTPSNIGAAASSHTHSYLPLSGGTMTGSPTIKCAGSFNIQPTNSIHIDLDNASSTSNIYIRTNLSNSNNGAVLFMQDSRSVSYGQIGIAAVANSASTQGVMRLVLGNSKVVGSSIDNSRGAIRIYSPNSGYTELYNNSTSSNISVALPSSSGTLSISSSDIRLKENIKDTDEDNALGLVNSINFRQFDWKESKKHQKLGFIADELEEIDEHLVLEGTGGYDGTDENGDPIMNVKCVDTFYLMGYYGKAIQELSEIIDKQNKKIKALEEQIIALSSK